MESQTLLRFDEILIECRKVFVNKMKDYGTAWRILRAPSLTDQIFIKARRIRSITEKKIQLVDEDIGGEFIGVINYALMALIQLESDVDKKLTNDEILGLYDKYVKQTRELLLRKNHDYGEAWQDMRLGSFVDIILMKLLRVKQIEDNQGLTLVSEGIDANYYDIINYSVFALIVLQKPNAKN